MSIFDHVGEQYGTATAKTLGYKHIGWLPETTAL
jgi:hypothetical protein